MNDINMPIMPFQIGDEVYCLNCGAGKVIEINLTSELPIVVKFKNISQAYSIDGKLFHACCNRCLFHADENAKVTYLRLFRKQT